jgi:hypothetical protein
MEFEKAYEDAVKSGRVPGFTLLAGNDAGSFFERIRLTITNK